VTFPIGERRSITAGSTGKVFLAFMDESERETVLTELKLVQYTPVTITDRKRLEDEISEVRTRGYSINFGEYTVGINGVAAPVFDEYAKLIMTITAVGFPHTLYAENINSIGQQTYDAACEVTRFLNGKLPPSLTGPTQYVLASDQLIATVVSEQSASLSLSSDSNATFK
jgi:DNA-binding IclR family transcriptional regulator